jgi:alpha-L-fucosidase
MPPATQQYAQPIAGQWPIGIFMIKSKHNGLYMDAKGQGTKKGTDIIMWALNNGKNQQWSFEAGGVIRNLHNGLVIDIRGGSGSDIHLWTYEAKTHQQWKWDGAHIISLLNGQVLDVKGGSQKQGVEVLLWPNNGGKNQEWELVPVRA